MNESEGKYNIKAISTILGIHPGTLRAWERRYKVIEPKRNDAGHRLYTEDHLKILKWILGKIKQGFTVGQAVELLDRDEMLESAGHENLAEGQLDKLKNDLLHTLLKFDEDQSNKLLDYAFNVFSVEKVVIDMLGSILVEIGDKWERNEITAAHEHFATSFMRTKIGMVFHQLPVNSVLPKVMCVCAPEERHEMGLLMFTFFLRRRGYETIYLGAGIPEQDIYSAAEEIQPKIIIISCTLTEHLPGMLKLSAEMNKRFPELSVGMGGDALKHLTPEDRARLSGQLIGNEETQWLDWLKSIK